MVFALVHRLYHCTVSSVFVLALFEQIKLSWWWWWWWRWIRITTSLKSVVALPCKTHLSLRFNGHFFPVRPI